VLIADGRVELSEQLLSDCVTGGRLNRQLADNWSHIRRPTADWRLAAGVV